MNSGGLRRVIKCKNEHRKKKKKRTPGLGSRQTLGSSSGFTHALGVASGMLVTSFILASVSPLLIKINSQTCTVHHASNSAVGVGSHRPTGQTRYLNFQENRPCIGGDQHMRSFQVLMSAMNLPLNSSCNMDRGPHLQWEPNEEARREM